MPLPDQHGIDRPDAAALVIGGSGAVLTWAALIERSNRLANHFHALGLRPGDQIAYVLLNGPDVLVVAWAARRAGLRYTPVNTHLKTSECAYILQDCGAQLVIAERATLEIALSASAGAPHRYVLGNEAVMGFLPLEAVIASASPTPLEGQPEGYHMCYSSGTTGLPKGIKKPMGLAPYGTPGAFERDLMAGRYGFDRETVFLMPTPLYFAGGIGWTLGANRIGATTVVMERFDAEEALRLIETYRITHAYFVPIHFVRMLKLPEEARRRYDLSSLKVVIHAAAPTPVEVKQAMIDWLGPILEEFYSSTETPGFVCLSSPEWLAHRGSVGRALIGKLHIVDESTRQDLPPGEVGIVCFEGGAAFEYHNAPEKTREAYEYNGWATNGDMGYVDADGYLYLTDRRSNMIISGGVNIYPQEAESVLIAHHAVRDVAVIGVPHAEFGEEVKAVAVLERPEAAGPGLERELVDYARARLAHYKCPKSVDFVTELPRLETGKLLKRELLRRYR